MTKPLHCHYSSHLWCLWWFLPVTAVAATTTCAGPDAVYNSADGSCTGIGNMGCALKYASFTPPRTFYRASNQTCEAAATCLTDGTQYLNTESNVCITITDPPVITAANTTKTAALPTTVPSGVSNLTQYYRELFCSSHGTWNSIHGMCACDAGWKSSAPTSYDPLGNGTSRLECDTVDKDIAPDPNANADLSAMEKLKNFFRNLGKALSGDNSGMVPSVILFLVITPITIVVVCCVVICCVRRRRRQRAKQQAAADKMEDALKKKREKERARLKQAKDTKSEAPVAVQPSQALSSPTTPTSLLLGGGLPLEVVLHDQLRRQSLDRALVSDRQLLHAVLDQRGSEGRDQRRGRRRRHRSRSKRSSRRDSPSSSSLTSTTSSSSSSRKSRRRRNKNHRRSRHSSSRPHHHPSEPFYHPPPSPYAHTQYPQPQYIMPPTPMISRQPPPLYIMASPQQPEPIYLDSPFGGSCTSLESLGHVPYQHPASAYGRHIVSTPRGEPSTPVYHQPRRSSSVVYQHHPELPPLCVPSSPHHSSRIPRGSDYGSSVRGSSHAPSLNGSMVGNSRYAGGQHYYPQG